MLLFSTKETGFVRGDEVDRLLISKRINANTCKALSGIINFKCQDNNSVRWEGEGSWV